MATSTLRELAQKAIIATVIPACGDFDNPVEALDLSPSGSCFAVSDRVLDEYPNAERDLVRAGNAWGANIRTSRSCQSNRVVMGQTNGLPADNWTSVLGHGYPLATEITISADPPDPISDNAWSCSKAVLLESIFVRQLGWSFGITRDEVRDGWVMGIDELPYCSLIHPSKEEIDLVDL